jgi:hypothetical protein
MNLRSRFTTPLRRRGAVVLAAVAVASLATGGAAVAATGGHSAAPAVVTHGTPKTGHGVSQPIGVVVPGTGKDGTTLVPVSGSTGTTPGKPGDVPKGVKQAEPGTITVVGPLPAQGTGGKAAAGQGTTAG